MENEFSSFGKPNNPANNANFPGSSAAPPRSWFSRNMWWFLPLLFLLLLSPCVCCGGFYFIIMGTIKSSQPYKLALERVSKDPQVIQELGQPIEQSGWMLSGSVNYNSDNGADSGHAQLEFDVAGQKGKAHVFTEQVLQDGKWVIQTLDVTPASTKKTISLPDDGNPGKAEKDDGPALK